MRQSPLMLLAGIVLGFTGRGLLDYYLSYPVEPEVEVPQTQAVEPEYPDLPEGAINDLRRKS